MKLILVLIIAAAAIVSSLWIFGFVGSDAAGDLFTRSTAFVAILGGAVALSYMIMKPNSSQSESSSAKDSSINPGPKF